LTEWRKKVGLNKDEDKDDDRWRSAREGVRPGNGIATTMMVEGKARGRVRDRGTASGTTTTMIDGEEQGVVSRE